MDLSFTMRPWAYRPDWAVSLADIRAAGRHVSAFAVQGFDEGRPGWNEEPDLARILACFLVQGGEDIEGAEMLGGSFNPRVADQLGMGKTP